MKRKPQSWSDRLESAIEAHPNPALEDWRWAREGDGVVDARAVSAAWDVVTLAASAEAAKINHIIGQLVSPLAKTLFPALVVAGTRLTEVGVFQILDRDSRAYWPRDLAFIVGREHLEPQLTIRCGIEIGRSVVDFLVSHTHVGFLPLTEGAQLESRRSTRTMALVLQDEHNAPIDRADRRARDLELEEEGHLVVRVGRSELWKNPIEVATECLRTVMRATAFDVEQQIAEASA